MPDAKSPEPRLVDVKTAAESVSVSTRTIRRFLDDGRLTRYTLAGGRTIRVDIREVYRLFGLGL